MQMLTTDRWIRPRGTTLSNRVYFAVLLRKLRLTVVPQEIGKFNEVALRVTCHARICMLYATIWHFRDDFD